ncbi:MAG TPA: hypothetical protein VK090_04315, partial [Paracoccaceae bacterium]|nr:hypothetical protein [Paracoccaceae bacterium]
RAAVLLLSGRDDPFAAMAPALIRSLQESGAALDARVLAAGHGLAAEDAEIASTWLKAQDQRSIT